MIPKPISDIIKDLEWSFDENKRPEGIQDAIDALREYDRIDRMRRQQDIYWMDKWADTMGARIDYSDVGGTTKDIRCWQWPDIYSAYDHMHSVIKKFKEIIDLLPKT